MDQLDLRKTSRKTIPIYSSENIFLYIVARKILSEKLFCFFHLGD